MFSLFQGLLRGITHLRVAESLIVECWFDAGVMYRTLGKCDRSQTSFAPSSTDMDRISTNRAPLKSGDSQLFNGEGLVRIRSISAEIWRGESGTCGREFVGDGVLLVVLPVLRVSYHDSLSSPWIQGLLLAYGQ